MPGHKAENVLWHNPCLHQVAKWEAEWHLYMSRAVPLSDEACNALQTLTEAELMDVLTKPKNALAKQYERMFGMSRARMHITQPAKRAIAQAARERGTGARGLRSIMENLLQPVMYDVSMLPVLLSSSRAC